MEKLNKRINFFSNLPNNITALRILLVPAFIFSLLGYTPQKQYFIFWAVGIFLTACFTDALDGFVARKLKQQTVFGSYIDPIADKLLLSSGFLCLSLLTHLPAPMRIPGWVTLLVISRDVIILIGSALIFLSTGSLKAEPLFISKLTTLVQMVTLCAVLFRLPHDILTVLFILTAVLTVLSGVLYIRMGEKIFNREPST